MHTAPRILIVDDVIENVAVLGDTLSDNFEIQFATSGAEALDLVAQRVPDLILLDVMMPGMDGYEVCSALKRDPATRDVPVIFVTAKNDAESESRALAGGAVDFIHKPINRDVVRARVQLQIALRSRELEMQDLHAQLARVVDERTRALGNALTLARDATRAREGALSGVALDVLAPMAAIVEWAELALRTSLTPKQRDYLENIDGSGQRLLEILGDLTGGRPAASGGRRAAEDFDPESLVEYAVGILAARVAAKGVELTVDLAPDLPSRCSGDPVALRRTLASLLSHAIALSDGAPVSLTVSSDTDAALSTLRFRCRVERTSDGHHAASPEGGALPPDLVEALDAARRVACSAGGDAGVERPPEGGVLLWFAVKLEAMPAPVDAPFEGFEGVRLLLVEPHERSMSVIKSVLERNGFVVEAVKSLEAARTAIAQDDRSPRPALLLLDGDALPDDAAAAVEALHASTTDRPKIVMLVPYERSEAIEASAIDGVDGVLRRPVLPGPLRRTMSRLIGPRSGARAAAAPAIDAAASDQDEALRDAQVLLVEDNAINRLVVTEQLKRVGCLVDIAQDGAVAVEKVRRNRYDVVLMDLLMPVMDGLTATREIRKLPLAQDLPIMAMTASAMDQDRQRCFDAGMNDFVTKPIDPADFWPKLRMWVQRHRASDRGVDEPQHGASAAVSGDPVLESIAGLDALTGLRQSLGRRALYLSLLERFVAGHRDFPERMEAALAAGDRETAERLAHTLKGVAAQVGAGELRDLAERLVVAIRRQDALPSLRAAADEIGSKLVALTRTISRHLPDSHRGEAAAAFDPKELRLVCRQLAEQLRENYLTALPLFEKHEALLRAAFGAELQEISQAIYVYDFDVALERLAKAAAAHDIPL